MVAAKDVATDTGVAHIAGDCVAHQEVIDAPACVVLAGIKAVAPPAVDALDVRIGRAPGVGKTGVEQLGNLPRSSSEKPALPRLDLGFLRSISSCATLKSPQVTTGLPVSRSSALKKSR